MSSPIEEHINYYQHFAPNPTAFRESLENALVYAKNSNKNLNMDLRDYFAAKAMQGLIASPKGLLTANKLVSNVDYAEAAYSVADAMMKAREQ